VCEPVVAGQEVVRPGDAALRHLRALQTGLCHPALHDAHAQRAVDVALEAAAAAVERERQRMQRLFRGQPEDPRCRCCRREHDDDAGRIEPVVLRLAQVESRAELGACDQRGQELRAGAAAGELGGGQRRRNNAAPMCGPGAIASQKSRARHIVAFNCAAATAGRRSP